MAGGSPANPKYPNHTAKRRQVAEPVPIFHKLSLETHDGLVN
jgi:hypothetical protein